MKNENQENLWNADVKHQEREERMESLKDEQGRKKPLKISNVNPWVKVVSIVVALCLALGLSTWGAFAFGLPQRSLALAYVGTEKVSIIDYNYTYNAIYNMYNSYASQGYMPLNAAGTLDLDALSPFEQDGNHYTYGEYIQHIAKEELKNIKLLLGLAKQEGISLTDEEKAEVEQRIEEAQTQLGGQLKLENALVSLLGPGSSKEEYRRLLLENVLIEKYTKHRMASYTFTSAEIQEEYEANKDNYDQVTFREFVFYPESLTDAEKALTQEEQNKLLEEKQKILTEQVNNFVALVSDETSFKEQVVSFSAEGEKEINANDSVTLRSNLAKSALTTDMATWLFAPERKLNDIHVFDVGTTGKRVVLFVKRARAEEQLRTIASLVLTSNVTVTEENKEAVTQALDGYEKTVLPLVSEIVDEASLEKVAKTLTEQGLTEHHLWYDGALKANLPTEAATWAFDESRKEGEHYIIKSAEQGVLSLFVYRGKQEKTAWENAVIETLKTKRYEKEMEELKKDDKNQLVLNAFLMHFTSPIAKGKLNGNDLYAKQKALEESLAATSAESSTESSAETSAPSESK